MSVDQLIQKKEENRVANRLDQIGDTLLGLAVIIGGIAIIVSVVVMTELSVYIGLPILIIAVIHILIFYIIQTLFNGLAENIRILHDIRNDMRNK